MPEGLLVRVLGPVEIGVGDELLPVRRLLERGLVVRLALARGVVVSDERLAADLWDEDGEDGGAGSGSDDVGDDARIARLRVVVSRLRRTLGAAAGAVVRGGGGYRIAADVVDLRTARAAADRVHAAVRAGDHEAVRRAGAEALGAWRGSSLSDLRALPFARGEGERLDAWRVELTVSRLRADLARGAGAEIVAELSELSAREPLHEPLRGLLAVALYRAGRQGDALAELAALRRALADDLGADPTADTVALELRLLRQDLDLQPSIPTPAASPAPSPTDIRPALARGLVGRREELVALADRLDDALRGRPAVLLIEGGPGTGRTRLLEALSHLSEQHGALVCWGRASAGAPAFWPWRQAMRQWKQRTPPETAAAVLTGAGGGISRIVPELRGSTDSMDGPAAPSAAAGVDPDDRFGVFEHVVAFLDAAAATAGPGLVLLLDDLELADVASLLLLAHLARSETATPVLVAATLRPGELGSGAVEARAEVRRQPATSTLELAGLTDSAVAEQLSLVLGRDCDPRTAADVARRTGGNPLFVREIGRALVSGEGGVPAAIRDTVRRRVETLPEPLHAVLSAAAVLAGEVDADLVAAALAAPVLEVLDALDEGVTAGLLQWRHDPERYRFAHDIVRDAVALDLAAGRRARLHLRAAEHLEALGVADRRVAHHRLEALPLGDREQAVHAAAVAADLALRQFAFEEAVGLYDRAIGAAVSTSGTARGELLVSKARAQHLGHDVSGAMATCESAAALAEHLDDPVLLGRAALVLHDVGDPAWLSTTSRWCRTALARLPPADGAVRAQLTAHLAVASVWDDEEISAEGTVEEIGVVALEMADRVGDPTATYTALRARQLARSGPEGTRERLGLGARMLGLVPGVGDPAELWGRLWRFDALVQLGRVDEADDELDLLEHVVARMRQPLPHWHLVRSRAALLSARGRFVEARAAADEAVQIAQRGNHRSAEYPAHALRLSIGLLTGDPVDPVVFEVERYQPPPHILTMMAAEWHATHGDLTDAARLWARLPRPESTALKPFMHVMFHATSGPLAAALGDRPAVEHAYLALLPHADLHIAAGAGVSATSGSVQRVLGVLAASLDRIDTAVEHLRAAVAANDASGLAPYTALAQMHLADQLRRRGGPADIDEAATVDAHAAAALTRLGMPHPR